MFCLVSRRCSVRMLSPLCPVLDIPLSADISDALNNWMALASTFLMLAPTLNAITEGMYVLYPIHLLTFFFPALCSWSPISPCHMWLHNSLRLKIPISHTSVWAKNHTSYRLSNHNKMYNCEIRNKKICLIKTILKASDEVHSCQRDNQKQRQCVSGVSWRNLMWLYTLGVCWLESILGQMPKGCRSKIVQR